MKPWLLAGALAKATRDLRSLQRQRLTASAHDPGVAWFARRALLFKSNPISAFDAAVDRPRPIDILYVTALKGCDKSDWRDGGLGTIIQAKSSSSASRVKLVPWNQPTPPPGRCLLCSIGYKPAGENSDVDPGGLSTDVLGVERRCTQTQCDSGPYSSSVLLVPKHRHLIFRPHPNRVRSAAVLECSVDTSRRYEAESDAGTRLRRMSAFTSTRSGSRLSASAPLAVARDGRRASQKQPVGSDAIAEVSDLAWLTEFKLLSFDEVEPTNPITGARGGNSAGAGLHGNFCHGGPIA